MDTAKLKQTSKFLWYGFSQLLWPGVCVNCKRSNSYEDENLCKKCWDELLACTAVDYCRRCGRDVSKYALVAGACPNCQGKEIHFDGIARGGVYINALKKMILAFKNSKTELDLTLGFLANAAIDGSSFAEEIDFFVPVPLHWSRRLIRGYNQSLILAKQINHTSAKINTDLVRIRKTRFQSMVSYTARIKNVAGAFAVRRGHKFTGAKVCLVDDIKTSGATLNECAKTLKDVGALSVFALVLSVAGQNVS